MNEVTDMTIDLSKHKFFIISESFPDHPLSLSCEKNPFDKMLSDFLRDYGKNIYKDIIESGDNR